MASWPARGPFAYRPLAPAAGVPGAALCSVPRLVGRGATLGFVGCLLEESVALFVLLYSQSQIPMDLRIKSTDLFSQLGFKCAI